MASPVPAKSQPLHYFSLPPQLKWKKNHTNNHHRGRSRLADSSPQQSPPPDAERRQSPASRQSPILDSASESDSGYAVSIKSGFTSRNNCHFGFSLHTTEKSDKKSEMKSMISDKNSDLKSTVSDVDVSGSKERRSKIYIRLPKKKTDEVPVEGKACSVEGEVEESVPKTWNLRPRRPIYKPCNGDGGTHKIGVSMQEKKSQLPVIQNRPELEVVEKKEKKQKFSISLSREEIEEDIFALTGSKPSRRPKKRPRAVQKQLDNLFPGLWLGMITPDSYKVSEAPPKV